MRRLFLLILLLSVSWWLEAEERTRIVADTVDESKIKLFQRFAAELERNRGNLKIPGMSVGVIINGELVWAQGFGFADLEKQVKATPYTPFRLSSVTKTFSAQIVMHLVEQGKVNLENPVRKYGIKIKNDAAIRVKHILSHSSEGIPGTKFKYNPYRYDYLGKVIKKTTGKSFQQLVITRIIEPAGMMHTAFRTARTGLLRYVDRWRAGKHYKKFLDINQTLARPYDLSEEREVISLPLGTDLMSTGCGLISNVIDLAKYHRAIDNNVFMSQESRLLAFSPFAPPVGEQSSYGFGWFVQFFQGIKLVWHYGFQNGYIAIILKVPRERASLIILANSSALIRPLQAVEGYDVLYFPGVVEFLKTIVFRDKFDESVLSIDWEGEPAVIASRLGRVGDGMLKALLKKELLVNLFLHRYMKREKIAHRLGEAFKLAFPGEELPTTSGAPEQELTPTPLKYMVIYYVFWAGIIFCSGSGLVWLVIFFLRLVKKSKRYGLWAGTTKFLAVFTGIIWWIYMVGFPWVGSPRGLKFLDINGMHLEAFFEVMGIVIYFPQAAAFFTGLVLILTALAWKKKYWLLVERIHYTSCAATLLVITLLAYHSNLLG
ncbi:MAG: serine hydrolase domain-containing protein [Candidatus Aminicenantes bacterium]